MDAFEDPVARLLRREGFWTRQSYRINLTKADKVAIGKPSLPRPELDILAYKPVQNLVAWVECKSYLDSSGVHSSAFDGRNPAFAQRFKTFTDDNYREIATRVLVDQLVDSELVRPDPAVQYWLIAGNVAKGSQTAVSEHFAQREWVLRGRDWITAELQKLMDEPYEDDVVTMAAKLLRS